MKIFAKGEKVVVQTGDYFVWRKGIFHTATIIEQTEYQAKVLFDNKNFGIFPVIAWISKFNIGEVIKNQGE